MDKFHKVPVTKILAINEHTNATSLELATVYGFQVVVPKNRYSVGDSVVYIPIDSILPEDVEEKLFGKDAKVKLTNSRVRQIKLRGAFSQGMVATPEELGLKNFKLEEDVSKTLGITKYEPPMKEVVITKGVRKIKKGSPHPDFTTYNGLTNIKWIPTAFEGKNVVISEKLHGCNARASMLPYRANTLMKRVMKFLGLTPTHEFVYGSNQVDITNSNSYKGFYGEDVYGAVFKKINAHLKLEENEIIYGEIIGPKIQKDYDYGLKEHKFILFDVKRLYSDGSQEYLNPDEVEEYAKERGFDFVPVLYKGPFNLELAKQMAEGPSVYAPVQKVREGVVVKLQENYSVAGQKQAAKIVGEGFLSNKDNTDFN